MKLRHALAPLAVAGLLIVALSGTQAQASSGSITYAVSGTVTTSGTSLVPPNCATLDALACPVSAQGTATCTGCPASVPQSGTFALRFTSYRLFPPSPCRVKSMDGRLDVTWSDARTTSATVSGSIRDDKTTLLYSGTTDATSTAYPPQPMRGVLTNFPPVPMCTAGSNPTTGTLTFYPPTPI
jgi:hypothetical protein